MNSTMDRRLTLRSGGWRGRLVLGAALALFTAVPLAAQPPQSSPSPDNAARRAALEKRLTEQLALTVQRELRLTPQQGQQLRTLSSQIDSRRRPLIVKERELRGQLRAELERGTSADQGRVDRVLKDMLTVHRQRLDLLEDEQRELAKFLTPVQRARYLSIQENWRRRVQEQEARDGRERSNQRGRNRRPPVSYLQMPGLAGPGY